MKFALAPRQRALLLFVSASAYMAWFSGLGSRSDAAYFDASPRPAITIDERATLPPVASLINRDPFAANPAMRAARAAAASPSGTRAAAGLQSEVALTSTPAGGDMAVPDIDGQAQLPVKTLTLVLRATIVGPQPVAYVANGAAMDIVRVGDTLGDRRVMAIDLRGIVFSDGTRLDLPPAYEATPRPQKRRTDGGERISLDALRRLLLAPQSAGATTNGTAPPTPQPAPSSTYPSPGPLPTVNMQGLPVGVNPTPNPNEPTPYPYPYPYAPPPH